MKKILVVDDSPFMLRIMSDILTGMNYEVSTVDNGKAACNKVMETRYDLMITDLNMPEMDGLEFVKQVRTLPNSKFVPIVMLSGEEDGDKIAAAKKLGVSTFLSKPPQESQLQNILQVIANKRSAKRVPVQLDATWINGAEHSGVTRDISTSGMYVETTNPLSLGEKAELHLNLPESPEPISCPIQVAWVFNNNDSSEQMRPTGMGVEFLDNMDMSQVEVFIKTLS